jgi:uncharacterized damage-inducible protein DinB
MSQQLLNQAREINEIHTSYMNKAKPLSYEQFNKKPAPDQWSIAQVLHHLWNAYNFSQTFMEKRIQEKKVTQTTGLKTLYKYILLQVALALPIKYKAPRAIADLPAEVSFDVLEQSFKQTALNYEKMLDNLPAALEDKEIFKHPRVGYLNASQTFSFIKAHALHHKAQIENLLKNV